MASAPSRIWAFRTDATNPVRNPNQAKNAPFKRMRGPMLRYPILLMRSPEFFPRSCTQCTACRLEGPEHSYAPVSPVERKSDRVDSGGGSLSFCFLQIGRRRSQDSGNHGHLGVTFQPDFLVITPMNAGRQSISETTGITTTRRACRASFFSLDKSIHL